MKNKIAFKSWRDINLWISISKVMANSLISPSVALKQFNELAAKDREGIKKSLEYCDVLRREKINRDDKYEWELSMFVDAHIVATEYNIDPIVVFMCANPICRSDQKVYPKKK